MMNNTTRHFINDIWISAEKFHCTEFETELNQIETVDINFKVPSAAVAFITLLASAMVVAYGYIHYKNYTYPVLLGVIAVFCWLRYVLRNYVDLFVTVDGKKKKILTVGMGQRHFAYEIEDFMKRTQRKL